MKVIKLALVGLVIANLCACATIFQGEPDKIPVNSNPEGATVSLNGYTVGTTPCVISIRHDQDAHISIQKQGYEKVDLQPGKVMSGTILLDLFLPITSIVDFATCNQGHYPADPINASLQKRD